MTSVGARLRSRLAAGRMSHEDFTSTSTSTSTRTTSTAPKPLAKPMVKPPTTPSLSEKDERDVHTAFGLLDRDGDGEVGIEDVTASLQELGFTVPRESVQTFISKLTHGGSALKESDLQGWVEGRGSTSTAVLQLAFAALDRDNDGYITQEDLKFGLSVTHENLSPSMLSLMFEEADSDHDGKIDIKDFLRALGEI